MVDAQPKTFDAPAHMRKIRTRQGMQDYLDVRWRVAWFNAENPSTGSIITEQIEGDEQHARFKATVTITRIDTAQMFTGHGSETLQDFPDFYEKAETKAIGRALALAGYGTEMAADLDDGEPMDGRAAAKDERADRKATPEQREAIDAQHAENTGQAPTRRAGRTPASSSTRSTPEDKSNVHQHAQLRTLAEHGFDVVGRLVALKVGAIEELTREQAKELIVEGRAAVRQQP